MSIKSREGEGPKKIGLPGAVALVVASMIGAGVFTSSGYALESIGDRRFVLLAWLVGGVLALCGSYCYAELIRRMPESGGEYYYLSRSLHPFAGYLSGWVSLCAGFTAPAAIAALAIAAYLLPLFGVSAEDDVTAKLVASAAVLFACAIHVVRRGAGLLAQGALVAVKLALLSVFLLLATVPTLMVVARTEGASIQPTKPFELGAFAISVVWISFAYSGWNASCYLASEVDKPKHNAPLSLIRGCWLVVFFYLCLNAIFLYGTRPVDISGQADVARIAAVELLGLPGAVLMSATVSLALLSSVSALILTGPRVYARMAEDGVFPKLFAFRGDTPSAAILLQSLLVLIAIWWSDLEGLLSYTGFLLGISSSLCVLGLLRSAPRRPALLLPGATYLLGTLGASVFLIDRRPTEAALGLLTLVAGALLHPLLRSNSGSGTGA